VPASVVQSIGEQVNGAVRFDRIQFVGATGKDHDVLAAYSVDGRTSTGQRRVWGLILIVRDGTVVAR
jgi:hypothetical protein